MTAPAPTPPAPAPAPPVMDAARDANGSNAVAAVTVTNGYQMPAAMPVDAVDTDHDGLTDDFEKLAGTNALAADSDSDGLTDGYEALKSHTDPLSADTDKDTIGDAVEVAAGSDAGTIPGIGGVGGLGEHASNIRDGVVDTDLDGLSDPYEMQIGSNPNSADSDLDGLADNIEVTLGTSPTLLDSDADGLTDGTEVQYGMDPVHADAGTGPPPVPIAITPPAPVVAPAPAPMPAPAAPATQTSDVAGTQVQQMIAHAMDQVGDQYVFGAEVSETDPDPSVWDCAEFTQWSAYQVGAEIPGSSFEQYLDLKAKGLVIPVEQGINTPGALLFHFSSEPQPGGGRPSQAHVALSLGDGTTVEAQSEEVGVIVDDNADSRFEYAALLPNVDYTGADISGAAAAVPAAAPAALPAEVDGTGLNIDMVIYGIKMQESRGDYQAENPTSTASGAYQYIDGTWDGYGGYGHAADAPPDVQDAKMRLDTQAAYDRLGDWERVIASHFAGEGAQAGPKEDWNKVPGYDYNQNPSIWEYVHGVEGHIAEADPSEFGGAAYAPASTALTAPPPPAQPVIAQVAAPVEAVPQVLPGFTIDPGMDISNPEADADNDGLTNQFETMAGTNPTVADTDADGLTDGFEASLGTNATQMDTDADGFTDGFEAMFGMDPLTAMTLPSTPLPGTGVPIGGPGSPTHSPLGDPLGSPMGGALPDPTAGADALDAGHDVLDAGVDPALP